MKKRLASLPAIALCLGLMAAPAAADGGDLNDDPVADPGHDAMHDAISDFRAKRHELAEACHGAGGSDECKNARSDARATFQTLKADAQVAHREFIAKLQAYRDAKTPEEKAAAVAALKAYRDEAKDAIDQHKDEHDAKRAELKDKLAKLDPKLRDAARKEAEAQEKAGRDKASEQFAERRKEAEKKIAEHRKETEKKLIEQRKIEAPRPLPAASAKPPTRP